MNPSGHTDHTLGSSLDRGVPSHCCGPNHGRTATTSFAVVKSFHRQIQHIGNDLRHIITLRTAPRQPNTRDGSFGSSLSAFSARLQRKGQALDERPINMGAGVKILEANNTASTLGPRFAEYRIPKRLQY